MEKKFQKYKRRITRDSVLFVAGLFGILYETTYSGLERPTLLLLFAGMVGLPAFIQRDERKKDEGTDERS